METRDIYIRTFAVARIVRSVTLDLSIRKLVVVEHAAAANKRVVVARSNWAVLLRYQV